MASRFDIAAEIHYYSNDGGDGDMLLAGSSETSNPMIYFNDSFVYEAGEPASHSPKPLFYGLAQRHDRQPNSFQRDWTPSPEPPFITIREGTPPQPLESSQNSSASSNIHRHHHHHFLHQQDDHNSQAALHETSLYHIPVPFLERTTSKTSPPSLQLPYHEFSPADDREAAAKVEQHLKRAKPKVKQHERILRALIHPKAHADKRTDFPLDNAALDSIFSAADEIFFNGKLSRRVHWDWTSEGKHASSSSSRRGEGGVSRIIGYTALRKAMQKDGYETLIVLSSPILKDTSYNRRLLISTFLHELIHSYLFICNGFEARHCGGHTPGFKRIAELIDEWEGHGTLRLCDIEADLDRFREEQPFMARLVDCKAQQQRHQHYHDQFRYGGHHHHHHDHHSHTNHHHSHHHQQQRQHHHSQNGTIDFYDLTSSSTAWSAGSEVIFRAHDYQARHEEARDGRNSPAMAATLVAAPMSRTPSNLSSAPTLVESEVQLRHHAHSGLASKLLADAYAYYPARGPEIFVLS